MVRPAVFALICVISAGRSAPGAAPGGLADRIWGVTDTVLDRHIDPPARPQMILGGLKSLYRAAGIAPPAGLARRVSAISSPEQLGSLIDELWTPLHPELFVSDDRKMPMEQALVDAI